MTESPETLTDRVLAQVKTARIAVDQRANAAPSGSRRHRRARPADPSSPRSESVRETKSLRRVFRDLGVSYRRYRKQTGVRVSPGLRDAAYNFRAEPSLTSLVTVAAFLDELDLLS
jgi:hypothetical protein